MSLTPSRRPLRILVGSALLTTFLGACGGGDQADEDWGLQFHSFDVSAAALDLAAAGATQFTLSWQARLTGGNPVYYVNAYLVPAASGQPVLDSSTQLMGRNCGTPINNCNTSGTQTCDYIAGSTASTRRIDCGQTVGTNRSKDWAPGDYKVIGQACYLAPDLSTRCSEKPAQAITLR